MDPDELQRRLLATFAEELAEQAAALERELLGLEREPAAAAEHVRTILRIAHAVKGAARAVSLEPVERICHAIEGVLAPVRDGTAALRSELVEPLLQVADALGGAAASLRAGARIDAARFTELTEALTGRREEAPREAVAPSAPQRGATEPPATPASLRVVAGELDELIGWSGELLTTRGRIERRTADVEPLRALAQAALLAQRHLAAHPTARRDPGLLRLVEAIAEPVESLARGLDGLERTLADDARALSRVSGAVESGLREVRMVPFARATEGLERACRDLARDAGKDVELLLEGGDVRLDRAVAEGLRDPLLQLVRNAIDHGIEAPDERETAGKPRRGRIVVAAELRGDQVAVRVEDDGRGLDEEAIRAAAGAADAGAAMSRLIFRPGFTTRAQTDTISGRGVGLDIVRGGVEALRGSVSVQWQPGRGTSFHLSLPLTLGTMRVLLVDAGGERFALQGGAVRRLMRLRPADIRTLEGREVVFVEDRPVALGSMAGLLGLPASERYGSEERLSLVIVEADGRQAAFAVDALLDEVEVIVKSPTHRPRGARFVAGAAMLPEGRVALILRPGELVEAAHGDQSQRGVAAAFAPPPAAARKRILLADDSLTTRALERSILEAAGYEVIAVADGAEAWQQLQAQGADLLVADVQMPRMDGFMLTETVRGARRFRDLPVVLVTGLEAEADRARGLQAGASAYIVKSAFDQKGLLDTIASLL